MSNLNLFAVAARCSVKAGAIKALFFIVILRIIDQTVPFFGRFFCVIIHLCHNEMVWRIIESDNKPMKVSLQTLILTLLALSVFTPSPVQAQEFWEKVASPSLLFSTQMRKEHEVESNSLLIGANRAVYSEEIEAIVDYRPYKNVFKNYAVTLDQTFGPMMSDREQAWLARREIDDLIKSYASFNHFIRDRDVNYDGRYKSEKVTLVYEDPDFGVQAVMLRVMVGDISKYKQLAIVPADFMDDMKVQDYFSSLRHDDGIPKTDRKIMEEWQGITSPHKIFSVKIPPPTKPFFTKDPVIKKTENAEVIRYVFRDPVRRQNLYYNLYGYKTGENLTFEKVEKIIAKNHIEPHRRDPSKVGLSKRIERETPFLLAEYNIPATKKIPYLNMVRLRVFFEGSFIFVQEIMGSDTLVNTPFVDNLQSLYKFHPEHAVPLPQEHVSVENDDVSAAIEALAAILEEGDKDALAEFPKGSPPQPAPITPPPPGVGLVPNAEMRLQKVDPVLPVQPVQ